jgi:V8-like Glu-specific endopeptidase
MSIAQPNQRKAAAPSRETKAKEFSLSPSIVRIRFLLGVPPRGIIHSPQRIVFRDAVTGESRELGLEEPSPPLPSQYVAGNQGISTSELEDRSRLLMPQNLSDLQLVTNPSLYPWCVNVILGITAGNGEFLQASGVLIDPRCVLTAAHVVYDHDHGGYAQSILVIPAYDGGNFVYGSANMVGQSLRSEWTTNRDFKYDFAILYLDRAVGAITGRHGYGYNGNNSFYGSGNTFYVPGYPAEGGYPGDRMYYSQGYYDGIESDFLIFDRCSYGGQSGSGSHVLQGSNRIVHAIHSAVRGACPTLGQTMHVRITSEKFQTISTAIAYITPSSPDLLPLFVEVSPATVDAGTQLSSLSYLIHNYSSVGWTGTVTAKVYLSTDATITASDRLIQTSQWALSLRAKGISSCSPQPPMIPSNIAGNFYVGVLLDISDANIGNNATTLSDLGFITVLAQPSITVTAPVAGATWTVGTTQTVTVPNNPSTTCRVKVESVLNTSVFGLNAGNFTIRGEEQAAFTEDFNDGDYTTNPTWGIYDYPGCGQSGILAVENGSLKLSRSGSTGCFGEAYIYCTLDIPIHDRTRIGFDTKVSYRSLDCGGSSGWGEMPAWVSLRLRLASGDVVTLRFAYCYGSTSSADYSDATTIQHGYVVQQNVWQQNQSFRIQDAWLSASAIIEVRVGGSGHDLESWFDNLAISEPVTSVERLTRTKPTGYSLKQNYPNPINPTTTLESALPREEFVNLKILNLLGQEITTVVSQDLWPGVYSAQWDASKLTSGVYFYRLVAGPFVETKKMLLLR